MQRAIALILLIAFLNFEVSYACLEVINAPDNRGENTANASNADVPKSSDKKKNSSSSQPADQPGVTNKPAAAPALKYSYALSPEQEAFLDTVFAGAAVPPANIPVLENALGDVVQDSVVNILDLLRVRDIAIGRPPAASVYEMKEGDLNGDNTINNADINVIRDILLGKTGVPAKIDEGGGVISHGTTNIVIPPGVLTTPTVLCVSQIQKDSVENKSGLDLGTLTSQGYNHMASFKLESPTEIPDGLPFQLLEIVNGDMIAPQNGFMGLYQSYADADGDGQAELRLMSALNVVKDTSLFNFNAKHLRLSKPNSQITIVESDPVASPPIISLRNGNLQVRSGDAVDIITSYQIDAASPHNIGITISQNSTQFSINTNVFDYLQDTSGIWFRVQPIAAGSYTISVQLPRTGQASNVISLQVVEPTIVEPPDSLINLFFSHLDTLLRIYDSTSNFHLRYLRQRLIDEGNLRNINQLVNALDYQSRVSIAAFVLPVLALTSSGNVSSNLTLASGGFENVIREILKCYKLARDDIKALERNNVLCVQCKQIFVIECAHLQALLGILGTVIGSKGGLVCGILGGVGGVVAGYLICKHQPELNCCDESGGPPCDDPADDPCKDPKCRGPRLFPT